MFLGCRALQGVANAFLTPLLLAALAESTPPERVGRSVVTFAAVQTAALVVAPLGGGLAGEVSWRLAFVAPALAALVLAALPLPGTRRAAVPPRLRAALVARVGWLSAAAFLGYLSLAGLSFLVALRAADEFGLSSSATGLLVAGFGAAGWSRARQRAGWWTGGAAREWPAWAPWEAASPWQWSGWRRRRGRWRWPGWRRA